MMRRDGTLTCLEEEEEEAHDNEAGDVNRGIEFADSSEDPHYDKSISDIES